MGAVLAGCPASRTPAVPGPCRDLPGDLRAARAERCVRAARALVGAGEMAANERS